MFKVSSKSISILFFFFSAIFFLLWWSRIFISGQQFSIENYLYGVAYAFVALIGGINGLRISSKWGGFRSYLGLGIVFLSLGLLGESFGQFSWAYYNLVLKVEVPYPSIADIGYFSIIPFYLISMFYFFKVCGVKLALSAFKNKTLAVIVPLIMISVSYYSFIKGQTLDFSQPLKTFLDLSYTMAEPLYVSLAIITLGLSRGVLGGIMKNKLAIILIYFIFQYITDYSFLYTSGTGTYYNGSFVDLFYALSIIVGSIGVSLFDRSPSDNSVGKSN